MQLIRESKRSYLCRMLTDKEKQFLVYWEKNREAESGFASKMLRGFPMAILFALPVILSVVVVRLFLPEWYTKISKTSPGMFVTVIFAVIMITLFYAVFRMHSKWEQNEEVYKHLLLKQKKQHKNQTDQLS
jgi:cbb3-type cytochrome oxidase subunit 3